MQGARVTWTLVVTNHSSQDAVNPTAVIWLPHGARAFVDVIAAPGWTATTDSTTGGCYFDACSVSYAAFRTSALTRGASVALSVVQEVLDPPGATVEAAAYVTTLPPGVYPAPQVSPVRASVTVEGSGALPSAQSQLSIVGSASSNVALSPVWVAFDPENAVYMTVGYGSPTRALAALLDLAGAAIGPPVELDVRTPNYVEIGQGRSAGGGPPILAWSDLGASGRVFTGALSVSGMMPVLVDVAEVATGGHVGAVAHSTTSHVSLVTYGPNRGASVASEADYTNAPLSAQRVAADGHAIGSAIEIARGAAAGQVKWNPLTNEFGVTYSTIRSFPQLPSADFARIGPDGTVRQRTQLGQANVGEVDFAVNDRTGVYIVVWRDWAGNCFAAEISRTGRLVSRGVIARPDQLVGRLSVTYNAVSGTFLVADSQGRALELNQYGAPLSSPIQPATSMDSPIVGTRPDAPEWIVLGNFSNPAIRRLAPSSEIVRTGSIDGGSDLRLGGCATADPFEPNGGGVCYGGAWLPPWITPPGYPVSGGCVTPDPFVVLGGGTCANDGWFPPGMAVPDTPLPGVCSTTDPFVALGGGVCVNGGWVPRTHPRAQPAPSQPEPSSCTGVDPFAAIGGGVCVRGGWVPSTHPLAQPSPPSCTSVDPFLARGGGVCVTGVWEPRSDP